MTDSFRIILVRKYNLPEYKYVEFAYFTSVDILVASRIYTLFIQMRGHCVDMKYGFHCEEKKVTFT
jgi:hypothetical protein